MRLTLKLKRKVKPEPEPEAFDVLPPEILAEIFSYIPPRERQSLRNICFYWKAVIDHFHGIHLKVSNMNWNSVQDCSYAKTLSLAGFSRDIPHPEVITSRLVTLELTDFLAYYSLMPLLEHCELLQSFHINCVTFLQKSRLPEYSSNQYLFNPDRPWLPRLKTFKFRSCTTQSGVYNHIVPTDIPEELFGLEHAARAFDISRGEMEFLPFVLQILTQSSSLTRLELILTDIWKIPFADLLQVGEIDNPSLSLDISLWHFGSKRLLPVGSLLDKVKTLRELRFNFPHHFDSFFIKFYNTPPSTALERSYQLQDVIVEQSLRWSQEMREVDIPWLQILERQVSLKRLHYPFPILGNDQRMAQIIENNSSSLETITFIGHREQEQEPHHHQGVRIMGPPLPWDAQWFANCTSLASLQLTSHARFLGPTNVSSLSRPELLPHSLTSLSFHGCIDLGQNPLTVAFSSLTNLKEYYHQARLCPWFTLRSSSVDGHADDDPTISELRVSHIKDVIVTLPRLAQWNLEWCDSSSPLISHFITPAAATVSSLVGEWLKSLGGDRVTFQESVLDRQMKSLKILVVSHDSFL